MGERALSCQFPLLGSAHDLATLGVIAVEAAKKAHSMVVSTRKAVVFDLGGVLARICHSWQEAAEVARVEHRLSPDQKTPLADFYGFDQYQAGAIELEAYLQGLAEFMGCESGHATAVHNSIIVEEYPGVNALVDELRAHGYRLGCLSNTNPPHWEHLALNGAFPTIASLDMKMASHLVGLNKPDPEIFRLYARQFELEPTEIYFFDDNLPNVLAAQREGWNAANITPGEDTAQQMRAHLVSWGLLEPR